jgi:hypothetical protein
MVSALTFLLFLLINMSSVDEISVPLKSHDMLIKVSPLVTAHWTEIKSPALMDSSPNENGMICGKTADLSQKQKRVMKRSFLKYQNAHNIKLLKANH